MASTYRIMISVAIPSEICFLYLTITTFITQRGCPINIIKLKNDENQCIQGLQRIILISEKI